MTGCIILEVTPTLRMADNKSLRIVSYNLYGLNSGRSMLHELCNDTRVAVVAVQEHWLTPRNLNLLNEVHPDFVGFGTSAMHSKLKSQIYCGRPFGGVGFLWRRSLASYIRIIGDDGGGRCLAMSLHLPGFQPVKLINVYFPCHSTSVQYSVELGNCLGFIEQIADSDNNMFVIGDMNFSCNASNTGYTMCKSVFDKLSIINCDDVFTDDNPLTYVSDHLQCSSFIDHCFVSSGLKHIISSIDVVESGANLSDHRPIAVNCLLSVPRVQMSVRGKVSKKSVFVWRWDRSNPGDYYDACYSWISPLLLLSDQLCCIESCSDPNCKSLIDNAYVQLVSALQSAASQSVVKVPTHSLKPFWNEELDRLKHESIMWHDIWLSAGKPSSGTVHRLKCSTKLKYKLAIREAYDYFENSHNDEMYTHFLNKRPTEFWKSWNAKFRRNISKSVAFDGCQDDNDIANKFVSHFGEVYKCSSQDSSKFTPGDASRKMHELPYEVTKMITVELVDSCIKKLSLKKACGPDDLSAEHLLYAHPCLVVVLRDLFRAMVTHGHVPHCFGEGVIIPLVKDKTGNLNSIDNYRPITLIPIVSKVFEHVLLSLSEDALCTDELQFGFKQGRGCTDAIFTLRTVISHFNARGSSVYLAALDIKKAFDSVNHDKLFSCLHARGVPVCIINILRDWYSKLTVRVRWGNALSDEVVVYCGVRQGGVISPGLFNVFINILICHLRSLQVGCHINDLFLGCLFYADDILLLCPSVSGLQSMLDVCVATADMLSLKFNPLKSYCLAIGQFASFHLPSVVLDCCPIPWVPTVKYLGVHIVSGRKLSFDINPVKQAFFAACNSVYAHAKNLDELLHLSLQESYCLPILTYAVAAFNLSVRQEKELNACWNSVYRKIFGFHKWESVKCCIHGLNRLDLHSIIRLRRVSFYRNIMLSSCFVLRCTFWSFFMDSSGADVLTVYRRRCDVVSDIWNNFRLSVS